MTNNIALKRIVAYLIDYIIITLISSALTYITFINPKYDEYIKTSQAYNEILQDYYDKEIETDELTEKTKELSYEINRSGYVYTIGSVIITFLYFSVFVYFTKGQTLGKRIMGIKIVSNNGKELKMYNYFIRTFILNGVIINLFTLIAICFKENTYLVIYQIASNFDMILMIIIFLMILFYKDGRGIHDILAGTKVIDVKDEIINIENNDEVKVIKPSKIKKDPKKYED